jgi:mono/diheme cytochrome c family protein
VGAETTTTGVSLSTPPAPRPEQVTNQAPVIDGIPPQFTAVQASSGEAAYNETCAVCHGTTLTNGTYGTPLAGAYFKNKWLHRAVRDLYQYAQTKMPPSHPGLLPPNAYTEIVAYILQTNGFKASDNRMNTKNKDFDKMVIQ